MGAKEVQKAYKDALKNREKKEWNSIVIIAPDNLANASFEDYYFYGSEEFMILAKNRINEVEDPDQVKVYVNLRGEGPHHIMVCSDKLCESSHDLPGKVEESQGLPVFQGITADGEKIIVHTR